MKQLVLSVVCCSLFSVFADVVPQTDYTQWVTLTNSDAKPIYSFQASGYWSDGAVPSADKDYYVSSGKTLMTQTSGNGHANFKGRNLAMAGATVPLLNARQKEFLTWTPDEICQSISNEVARKAAGETIPTSQLLEKIGTGPLAVDFRWRSGLGKVLLTVVKKGAESTPMVFHCAGGADRTGTVAFLLLGVLGTSDEQILKDYLVTGWGSAIIGNNYPKWLWQTVRSFDGFAGATLSERICAYFRQTLGFAEAELNAIRAIMLEG